MSGTRRKGGCRLVETDAASMLTLTHRPHHTSDPASRTVCVGVMSMKSLVLAISASAFSACPMSDCTCSGALASPFISMDDRRGWTYGAAAMAHWMRSDSLTPSASAGRWIIPIRNARGVASGPEPIEFIT